MGTGDLTLSDAGLYAISDRGLRNSQSCESSIPYSVRLRCDKNLTAWNRKLRRKNQVKTSVVQRSNVTFTVRMSLDDDMGNVMDLKLMAVRQDIAKLLAERFQKEPERIYRQIMKLLMEKGDKLI